MKEKELTLWTFIILNLLTEQSYKVDYIIISILQMRKPRQITCPSSHNMLVDLALEAEIEATHSQALAPKPP